MLIRPICSLCAINHMLSCILTHTVSSLMHCIHLVILFFCYGRLEGRITSLIAYVGHHGNDYE